MPQSLLWTEHRFIRLVSRPAEQLAAAVTIQYLMLRQKYSRCNREPQAAHYSSFCRRQAKGCEDISSKNARTISAGRPSVFPSTKGTKAAMHRKYRSLERQCRNQLALTGHKETLSLSET
jgi:hypothetical protein